VSIGLRCSVLQFVAVCCSVLQCAAVCCIVLQYVAVPSLNDSTARPWRRRGHVQVALRGREDESFLSGDGLRDKNNSKGDIARAPLSHLCVPQARKERAHQGTPHKKI